MAADTKAELVPPRIARRERKIVATDVVADDDEHRSPVIAEQAIAAFEHAPSQNVAGSCGVEHFGVVVATGGDQIGDLGAFAIDDAQVSQLVSKLESKYKRKVRAQVSVDSSLIGGIKIVIGDSVVDATVRGKLESLSSALIR